MCQAWRLLEIWELRIPVGKLFCAMLGNICIAGLKVTSLLIWFLIGFSLFPVTFLIRVMSHFP